MTHLDTDSLRNLPDDPRHYGRYAVNLTASLWPATPSEDEEAHTIAPPPQTAVVDDLSVSGLHLISPASFRVGQLVWVRMRLGLRTYQLKGTVRRTDVVWIAGQRCHEVGVQFVKCEDIARAIPAIAAHLLTSGKAHRTADAAPPR